MNPTNPVAQSRGATARANGSQPTESDRAAAAIAGPVVLTRPPYSPGAEKVGSVSQRRPA